MTRTFLRFAALTLVIVCGFTTLHAQSPIASLRPLPQSNRVPANADLGPQTQLTGHIPGWVANGTPTAQAVDLNANMELTIVLQRDPAVQAAFTQFLEDQQTPGNPLYHQWLTPQQVGTLFGPTASDLAAVTSWLTSQGLTIVDVEPNQILINVRGTTTAVGNAFRTSFGYFPLNGTARLSAVSEPFVPSALGPVVGVVFGLTDLPLYPASYVSGPHLPKNSASASNPSPQYTNTGSSGTSYYMTPGDFAIVYDSNSVLTGGNKGGGTNAHVAVIGRSRVAATDISEFATNTGIGSSYTVNTIIPGNGTDPGPVCTFANAATCSTGGDQGEQTLDVDRVVGNAPGATVDLIVATNLTTALQWNVSTVKDPIMTISYGGCEAQSPTGATTYDAIYSTGAAEGISTFVSSGDSAVNGCAAAFTAVTTASAYGPSPNWLCSSSYVTCVGGTEFADASSYSTYWNSTNATGMISAKSYIPEGAWNEPGTSSPYYTAGTGGGASVYIAKPSYQTGTGTLNDGHRDTPDMAYPAAQHDSYYACLDYALGQYSGPPYNFTTADNCTTAGGGYFFGFSGTSAAAPAMAGVTALLNTKLGSAQGSLNPLLYTLAATTSNNVFHDITPTTSGVGTCSVTVPSMCNNSTPGSSALSTTATGGMQGFAVTAGWDEATGWGSIDVANFLTAAAASAKVSTTLAVTATSNPISAGQSDTFTATLTRSSSTPGAATGTVQFYIGGVAFGSPVTISNNTATSASQTFSTAGTDSITAVYSGDTNYASSTAPAFTLTVSAGPTFSVTPVTSTYNLISGATTGNTDTINLASVNNFAGAVTMSCGFGIISGTANGSCAVSSPVTLTAGGTGSSTLTITTTPGTSGVVNIVVTGTNGTTVVTSSVITVNLTASSYTMAASPTSLSIAGNAITGNTTSVTITSVNNFSGTVTVGCASSLTTIASCTGGSAAVTPSTAGHVTVTVSPVIHSSGTSTLTLSGSGTTAGATIAATASTTAALTVTTVGSTTTVVASPSTVVSGSPTTLTATVTGVSVNGTPTGSVTFMSGTTTLGTSTLSGTATATYTYTPTTASTTPQSITAVYAGDSGYAGSTSAATNLTVTGFTATISSTNTSITVTSGATTGNTAQFTFTPVGAFTGTVTLTCSVSTGTAKYPPTCAMAPASVALTPGAPQISTLTITTVTPHAAISGPQHAGLLKSGGAVLALLVCMLPFRRRRFIRPLMAAIVLLGGLTVLSGCGNSTPAVYGSQGTYTVTVTGTSGTSTSAATIPLQVN